MTDRALAPGRADQFHRDSRPATRQVKLYGWKAVALDSGVTGHEYQSRRTADAIETWTPPIADSEVGRLTNQDEFTVTELTNEVAHTFQLRAVSADGDGREAEAGPVTPTPGICDRTQQVQDAILAELDDVGMTAPR